MAARLVVHPAFYRRTRHYRDRIGVQDARPQTALRFVQAVRDLVPQLLENPGRGHPRVIWLMFSGFPCRALRCSPSFIVGMDKP